MLSPTRRFSTMLTSVLAAGLVLTTAPPARAQGIADCSVGGRIQDTYGEPIPGARVMITDPEYGRERTLTADENGEFQGRGFYATLDYNVRVEADGYDTVYNNGVRFSHGPNNYDATLALGVPADLVDYDALNKLYEEGFAAYEAKDWATMESSIDELLEGMRGVSGEDVDTMRVSAHEILALGSFEQGDHDATLAATDEMLKVRPNSRSAHQLAGQVYTAKQDFEGALPHLRIAAAQSLDNPELQYNAGAVMLQLQHIEEGIEHMERALALRDEFPVARKNLGYAYLQTQEYDKSITMLEGYLEQAPDAPDHDNIEQMILALKAQIGQQ